MSVPPARMAATGRALAQASHPGPGLAVTATVTLLAVTVGHRPTRCLLMAAALLSGQLSIGWGNDAVDRDRDRTSGRPDKPVALGAVSARTTGLAAGAAATVCAGLSLATGLAAGGTHLAAVASGWAYNLRLKRTAASWLPYAASFGALPAFVTFALPGSPAPPWWLCASAALLGVSAHLTNALPDLDDDLATGVRGLPHRIGHRASAVTATLGLLLASALLSVGPAGRPDLVGWLGLAAAGTVAAVGLGAATAAGAQVGRVPFLAAVGVSLVDVTLMLARGDALG